MDCGPGGLHSRRGSLASIAARHGLKRGSVEKCGKREGWARLRREFDAAQLAKLFPPPPPSVSAPVAPDGAVSESWLQARQEIHYRKNAELVDKTRALLDAKLAASEKPSADELGKLTSALSNLIAAEIALLGLNRRKDKKRRSAPSRPEPVLEPE